MSWLRRNRSAVLFPAHDRHGSRHQAAFRNTRLPVFLNPVAAFPITTLPWCRRSFTYGVHGTVADARARPPQRPAKWLWCPRTEAIRRGGDLGVAAGRTWDRMWES